MKCRYPKKYGQLTFRILLVDIDAVHIGPYYRHVARVNRLVVAI